MTASEAASGSRMESRPARITTEILSPFHLVIPLPAVVGWHQTWPAAAGLWWGVFASIFGGIAPYALVLWRVRTGQAGDRHITRREQRLVPLIISIVMVLSGIVILVLGGAPGAVLAVQVALLGLGVTMAPITRRWKISFHAAVAAGTVAILAAEFGPVAAWSSPLVVLVAWSRVSLADHTVKQTIAGAVVGAIVCWVAYRLVA
ncbi:phosphatase PAP2 family protein [Sphaerisporangium sp. NPDC004334]